MRALDIVAKMLDAVFPPKTRPERGDAADALVRGAVSLAPARYDAILKSVSGTALFAYADPAVRNAIKALKYDGRTDIVARFAHEARMMLNNELRQRYLNEQRPVVVVPIPLTSSRYLERGFNQSALIASAVANRFPDETEYCDSCLVRRDFAQSQTQARTRSERTKNMCGAFEVRNADRIIGRDILLVDDIITTGATMREAIRVLRAAGARDVSSFALAH